MEVFQSISLFILVIAAVVVLAVIEKKYKLNLGITTFNDYDYDYFCFGGVTKQRLTEKDEIIKRLTQRIEVLEKIVTDPKEQLRKEIDQL